MQHPPEAGPLPRTLRRATSRHASGTGHSGFVSRSEAPIDGATPGSGRQENHALNGPGASLATGQHVNLRLPRGYTTGAACMPAGTVTGDAVPPGTGAA